MNERLPVTINVNGREATFHPDNTSCHIYWDSRYFSHDHVQIEGNQGNARIFGAPNLIMYLSGLELVYNTLPPDETETLINGMYEKYGWRAKTVLEDEPDEVVKEKYVQLATRDVQQESSRT
jgi:hypothetical protein